MTSTGREHFGMMIKCGLVRVMFCLYCTGGAFLKIRGRDWLLVTPRGLEVCSDGSDRLGKRGSSKAGWRKELGLFGAESKISSG